MNKFRNFVAFVVAMNTLLFLSSVLAEEIEGTLEITVVDAVGSDSLMDCKMFYSINTGDGKRTPFSLPVNAPPLSPSQRIKMTGHRDSAEKFSCEKINRDDTDQFYGAKKTGLASDYLPTQRPVLGAQRTRVIKLHFSDLTIPNWGKSKLENLVFYGKYSVNSFWKECSGGKMWLTGGVYPNWVEMPKPANYYGYGSNDFLLYEIIDDAVTAADPVTNYAKYDRLIFVMTGNGWGGFASLGKWIFQTNEGQMQFSVAFVSESGANSKSHIISHEMGHGFGLFHANSIFLSNGIIYIYGDMWDTMGSRYALISNLRKYILGWVDVAQIEILKSSGTVWVDQRELASSGKKFAVILLGFDNWGNPTFYFLEYFLMKLGPFDSRIFTSYEDGTNKDVVLLRKYEPRNDGDSLVYLEGYDPSNKKALDIESKPFRDNNNGISLRVIQKTGNGDTSQALLKVAITPLIKVTSIAVAGIGKVKVIVEVRDVFGNDLIADKVVCRITNKIDGKIYEESLDNASQALFTFNIPAGQYKVKVVAFKKGFKRGTFKKNLKVR